MALRTKTWDEPRSISDVLKYEDGPYCREVVTIKSGTAEFDVGMVLGQVTIGAATSAAKAGGNTGNGTLTMDAVTPILARAKVGVYQVRFIAAAANNGTFRVTDPDGLVLGDVVMSGGAGAWSNAIKFAIADGASDFIVGDGFDVTVAPGSDKWVPYKPAAVDGSQVAKAVALQAVDASLADAQAVVVCRHAEVVNYGLQWDASVNTTQLKAAAAKQLAAVGIIVRMGA